MIDPFETPDDGSAGFEGLFGDEEPSQAPAFSAAPDPRLLEAVGAASELLVRVEGDFGKPAGGTDEAMRLAEVLLEAGMRPGEFESAYTALLAADRGNRTGYPPRPDELIARWRILRSTRPVESSYRDNLMGDQAGQQPPAVRQKTDQILAGAIRDLTQSSKRFKPATSSPTALGDDTETTVEGALQRAARNEDDLSDEAMDSLHAEQVVLALAMTNRDLVPLILDELEPEDFGWEKNRILFEEIRSLSQSGKFPSALLLIESLRTTGRLIQVQAAYIMKLRTHAPRDEDWDKSPEGRHSFAADFCIRVRNHSIASRLRQATQDTMGKLSDGKITVQDAIGSLSQSTLDLAARGHKSGLVTPGQAAIKALERIRLARSNQGKIVGLPTGFVEIDEMTGGLKPTDFVVVAARPGAGKTAWMNALARHVSVEERKLVLYASLEMDAEQFAVRWICGEVGINSRALERGIFDEDTAVRVARAASSLDNATLILDENPVLTLPALYARAMVLSESAKAGTLFRDSQTAENPGGLSLILVDYLQIMKLGYRAESRRVEVEELARGLKQLARQVKCPVVALSQLSREVEKREDKRPVLSDLRECVTGDTLVLCSDGTRKPIKSLVGTQPAVLSLNADGKVEPARSDLVWSVGVKPVVKLTLASGKTIRATNKHRLLMLDGWKEIGNLRVGDRVATARQITIERSPGDWSDEKIGLLAHMIGDGSYITSQPLRYASTSPENLEYVSHCVKHEFGCDVQSYVTRGSGGWIIKGNGNRWHKAGVGKWLYELGVYNQRSHQKVVPDEVFRMDDRQIAHFLCHLWATDGSVFVPKKGRKVGLYYCTNSQGLAEDVVALLLRLGIVARMKIARKEGYKDCYHIVISGSCDQLKFIDKVGWFGPRREMGEKARKFLKDLVPNTNVDTIPQEVFEHVRMLMRCQGITTRAMAKIRGTSYGGTSHFKMNPSRQMIAGYGDILDDERLKKLATDDVFWDKIISIEPDGEEEVFDLTVPGNASWLADGIVSHNSGALEQEADIVGFLYRPSYYKRKESGYQTAADPDENICEFIFGKHRNGPLGTVRLGYESQCARFYNLM